MTSLFTNCTDCLNVSSTVQGYAAAGIAEILAGNRAKLSEQGGNQLVIEHSVTREYQVSQSENCSENVEL